MALTDKESDERDPLIFESFKALWPQKFPGVSYPEALIQAEQVAIAKNIEKEENLFAVRLASTVPLTEQEIATIQNPATKAKYQAIFEEQQIKRFGTEFPKVLKSLEAKAISVAGFNPTEGRSINTTTTFLLIAMQNKVEEYALEGEKSGVKREFISKYAVNKLEEYLAKAPNDKTNLFYKDPDSPNNAPNFPNLFGNAEIKAQMKRNKEATKTLDKLLADRNFNAASVINMPYALGDQNDYERISDQIQKDPLNVEYTAEIMKISRITQRTKRPMTPREVYNASIGAVNRVSMREPVVANEVNPVEDAVYQLAPEVQKLYNDIPNRTFNRANRLGAEITNSQGGRNNLPVRASMVGPTGALTYEANKQDYLNVGTAMESAGFQIGEHSAFDQVDPVHAGNSYHNYDEAFDVTHQTGDYNTSIAKTKQLKELIRSMNIFKEVIGPGDGDPNHETHLHLGGLIRPITQEELDLINSIN
jgi:hypothetical protein